MRAVAVEITEGAGRGLDSFRTGCGLLYTVRIPDLKLVVPPIREIANFLFRIGVIP